MSDPVSKSPASKEHPKPFRFALWHLFYFVALVASGLVVAGGYSFFISGAVLAGWWLWFRGNLSFVEILVVCFIVMILIGMFLPAVRQVREASRRIQCQNNLRQLMLAMLNYEAANQQFAPASTVDDQGQAMHSWRVLILPFIEEQDLYSQLRLDEPWDSVHNAQFAKQMPVAYRCPSRWQASASHTPYQVVSDPEAFFHRERRPAFSDAVDGSSSTIAIVETEHLVNWMQPGGISIEEALANLLNRDACHCGRTETLLKTSYTGQHVATLDGATYQISPNANPQALRRALRFSDGHAPDVSEFAGSTVVHKPQGYIALAMYLVLLALPGWYLSHSR